jgi:hypothetical protein
MRHALCLAAIAMTGCPGDDGPPMRTHDNPQVLWLALDGSEVEVKLVDIEPAPY